MKVVGITLREFSKQIFNEELLFRAIEQFISWQDSISEHVDFFLDIAVPDYRLDKLSGLYKDFVSQKDLLVA